jgi:hypothetical protein
MGKYDFDDSIYDYEEELFYNIRYSDDVTLIENVSHLRHHINCHGFSEKLYEYLNMDYEQICQVVECAKGSISVASLRKDFNGVMAPLIEEKQRKEEAMAKNEKLIACLKDKRKTMCGIGTRKLKLFLNKLIKQGDTTAALYRTVLEAEDFNIKAKDTRLDYKEKVYEKKHEEIHKLIELCREYGVTFGKQLSDVRDTRYVVYFELPNMEQISFHTDLIDAGKIPDYTKEWDGKRCSTLGKIENAINFRYRDRIEEVYK